MTRVNSRSAVVSVGNEGRTEGMFQWLCNTRFGDWILARESFWRWFARLDPTGKPHGSITIKDLRRHPAWIFSLSGEGLPWRDETWVIPLPGRTITGGLCGLTVHVWIKTANGITAEGWADLDTIDIPARVRQCNVLIDSRWCLAYEPSDSDIIREVRKEFATSCDGTVDSVFPVRITIKAPLSAEISSLFVLN